MKKYIFAIVALICFNVKAQNNYTGYHSNAFLLQSGSNPSAIPEANLVIGFPGLSNGSFGLEWPLSLNEVLVKGVDDSLRANLPFINSNLESQNTLLFGANNQLFHLGFKVGAEKKVFAYVGSEIVANVGFQFSDDLIDYLSNGNAKFLNQQVNLRDEKFETSVYHSLYLGTAVDVNEKLNVGARIKLLTGLANVHTDHMDIGMYTDSNSTPIYATTLSADLLIQTSGRGAMEDTLEFDPLLNSGFAFDLGASYQYNEKLGFSFALNDLGSITWDEQNNEYYTTEGEVSYVFEGLTQSSAGAENLQEQMEEIVDSLTTTMQPTTKTGTYTTQLSPNLYLGANYKLTDKHQFSFLFHNTKKLDRAYNGLSLGYQFNLAKSLQLLASYQNVRGMNNLGAGFVWSPGPVQMHMILDNTLSADVFDAKNFYLQFGISLRYGHNKQMASKED